MKKNQLPDIKFKSNIAKWVRELIPCAHLWEGYALEEPVLESTPLKKVNWANLFAYMHRRFGPPHVGGDDYKDLSAGWILTTPDSKVFVGVSPNLSGPGFSLTPYYQSSKEDNFRQELNLPLGRIEEVKIAYRATLLDLLRPVCVRDHLINAMGELGDSKLDESLKEYNENEDEMLYEVERHSSSGYPMPTGLFGGEDWVKLCTIIEQLGNGDMQKGRSAVIKLLQKDIFEEAAKQTKQVKLLMLMADYNQREVLKEGLKLSTEEMAVFDAELNTLISQKINESSVISELNLEDAEIATKMLLKLGMGSHGLKKRIINLKIDKSVAESFNALKKIAQDNFPDDAIPTSFIGKDVNLIEYMRDAFKAHGRQDLNNWLDETLKKPYGSEALNQIAWYTKSQIDMAKSGELSKNLKP